MAALERPAERHRVCLSVPVFVVGRSRVGLFFFACRIRGWRTFGTFRSEILGSTGAAPPGGAVNDAIRGRVVVDARRGGEDAADAGGGPPDVTLLHLGTNDLSKHVLKTPEAGKSADSTKPTIPLAKGGAPLDDFDRWDYAKLEAEAKKYKGLFSHETVVTLSAENNIPLRLRLCCAYLMMTNVSRGKHGAAIMPIVKCGHPALSSRSMPYPTARSMMDTCAMRCGLV